MPRDETGMHRFYRWPNPARGEFSRPFGGIVEVVNQYSRWLPGFGWLEVTEEKDADLVVGHLGTETERLDVFHLHGLMPTEEYADSPHDFKTNATIIDNIRRAKRVVCVSSWVADMLRRDMHMSPEVVGHGFDAGVWDVIPPVVFNDTRPKVIWNKTRPWGVCDPQAVIELAKRLPEIDFVTTFLPQKYDARHAPLNVKVTGLMPRWDAWALLKACDVYLGTTKETFGVGVLEAMASKMSIIGFNHGATPEVVGDIGLFVPPGDYDGLAQALLEALERRDELGAAGHALVLKEYSWAGVMRRISDIYKDVLLGNKSVSPRVTVVIPCYNKSAFVAAAIKSVQEQSFEDWELIVVDDASTDNSSDRIRGAIANEPRARLITHAENLGVAHARNTGVTEGAGEYIWCLDADDACAPTYLETMVEGLQEDPRLAIVYTGLTVMDAEGKLRDAVHTWPLPYDPAKGTSGNQIPTSCLYKRLWWERVGGYRQRYAPHGAGQEDADFWVRVLSSGGGVKMVSRKGLFHYRFHPDQVTRVHRDDWDKDTYSNWYPFVKDGQHPLASQLGVPPLGSWPVRNYDTPEVCVIIPVGPAHAGTVVEALDSVEAQTFRNWELYVVNDTGEDLDLTGWPYVHVINTKGALGPAHARNLGIRASSAPLLVFLDADDYLEPEFLEKTVAVWREAPDRWIYTDLYEGFVDGKREAHEMQDWSPERLWRKGVSAVTALYPRKALNAVGGFDETVEVPHEDWDLHVRLAKGSFCGEHLPGALFTYRTYLGLRRVEGVKDKVGATDIRKRHRKEDVMAGCGGCSKRRPARTFAKTTGAARKPAAVVDAHVADGSWVLMEYTGPVKVDQVFRGRAGSRRYLFGNNRHNKRKLVHPDDVSRFARKVFLHVVPGGK